MPMLKTARCLLASPKLFIYRSLSSKKLLIWQATKAKAFSSIEGTNKYEYEEYETSNGSAPPVIRRWRIKDKEMKDKVLSYPVSEEARQGLKRRVEKYPCQDPISNTPIFDEYFYMPRVIQTFGRSGKKVWAEPLFVEGNKINFTDVSYC